jgi:tetratricopeptide (TPR) repeat protein
MMKIHLQLQEDSDLESVQASLSIVDGICSSSTGLLQQAGYTLLARGLILLNNNDAAIQALQQAISMNNREDSLPWNTPSFILAKLLIGLKQLPAAVEVLRLCKNDVFAQLFESCLHILKNDYNSAFEVVGKLLKELPDCQTAKFIQLVILAHNHKYIEEETGKKKNLARIVKARSQMVEDGIGTEGLDLIDTFIEEIS